MLNKWIVQEPTIVLPIRRVEIFPFGGMLVDGKTKHTFSSRQSIGLPAFAVIFISKFFWEGGINNGNERLGITATTNQASSEPCIYFDGLEHRTSVKKQFISAMDEIWGKSCWILWIPLAEWGLGIPSQVHFVFSVSLCLGIKMGGPNAVTWDSNSLRNALAMYLMPKYWCMTSFSISLDHVCGHRSLGTLNITRDLELVVLSKTI